MKSARFKYSKILRFNAMFLLLAMLSVNMAGVFHHHHNITGSDNETSVINVHTSSYSSVCKMCHLLGSQHSTLYYQDLIKYFYAEQSVERLYFVSFLLEPAIPSLRFNNKAPPVNPLV